jgi:hypothetical protein
MRGRFVLNQEKNVQVRNAPQLAHYVGQVKHTEDREE